MSARTAREAHNAAGDAKSIGAACPTALSATVAIATGVVAFVLYLCTLAPSITYRFASTDSGDLASAVATWGIPHPTGYPLYVLLGGLITHLVPLGQIAFRTNLLSALCAAGACSLVCLTVLQLARSFTDLPWSVRCVIAVTAAGSLAVSRTFWSQAVLTEVYALEALFAAALVWLVSAPEAGPRRIYAGAFVAGLALTHHTTIVFTLIGASAVLLVGWHSQPPNRRQVATALLLLLTPLLLYVMLPLRAAQHPASNWGDPTTLGRFIDVVTGAPYHYLIDRSPSAALTALPAVARIVLGQFAWWIVPLALVGGSVLWHQQRAFAVSQIVAVALCMAFLATYRTANRESYMLQAYIAIVVCAGAGLLAVAEMLRISVVALAQPRRLLTTMAMLGLATVGPWLAGGWQDFNLRHDWSTWQYATGTLATLPAGGTILTDTDEATFPLWYAQRAEHLRPDVHVVDVRFRDPLHQR